MLNKMASQHKWTKFESVPLRISECISVEIHDCLYMYSVQETVSIQHVWLCVRCFVVCTLLRSIYILSYIYELPNL